MIYAIVLIVMGLLAILCNKKELSQKVATVMAWIAPLFLIWGVIGIIILTTARIDVLQENAIYWYLLIVGSSLEVILGLLFIFRRVRLSSTPACPKMYASQTVLGVIGILLGIATIALVYLE